jgi:hypothetical protein
MPRVFMISGAICVLSYIHPRTTSILWFGCRLR